MAEYTVDTLQIEVETESKSAAEKIDELTESLKRLQKEVEDVKTKNKQGSLSPSTDTSEIDSTIEKVNILKHLLDYIRRPFEGELIPGDSGDNAERVAKKVSVLNSALQGIKSTITKTANITRTGLKSIGSYVVSSFTKPFSSAINTITKWKNSIGRIAFYRAIRTAIKAVTDGFKTGIEDLYQYSRLAETEFAPAMNQLATSSLYLKNSLGAMAAPLIEAVAPAVDILIDKFVALINVIGKAFAALTGKNTYSQAVKYATEYADAANEAANSTQKFLLGIDELNVIDIGGGAGAADVEDYSSMFEEVEVPTEQLDWASQIRQAIEDGDWYGAGQTLAKKLNEVVSGVDFDGWGAKLGTYIQRGINAALGFANNFNWSAAGSKIAGFLNGIIDSVSGEDLGALLSSKFKIAFDFFDGFISTFDWGSLGEWISGIINGFFDEIDWAKVGETLSNGVIGLLDTLTEVIVNTDWAAIGEDIYNFLINIDWSGIMAGVAEVIGAALGVAISSLYTWIEDAWEEVVDWWYGIAYEDGQFTWSGLLNGLLEAIKNIGSWIKENIFQPFIDGFKAAFGIHSPSTVMKEQGKYIIDGLLEGMTISWSEIKVYFSEKIEGIKTTASEAWSGMKEKAGTKFTEIKETISGKWNEIKENSLIKLKSLETEISGIWNDVKKTTSTKFAEIKETVSGKWSDIVSDAKTWGKDICSSLASGISGGISTVTSSVKSIASKISEYIHFSEPDKGPLSNFHTYMPDMLQLMAKGINENAHLAINAASDLADSLADALNGISEEDLQFPSHENAIVRYTAQFADSQASINSTDGSEIFATGMRDANGEVVVAIYDMAQRIVQAIQDNCNVSIDGKKLNKELATLQQRAMRASGV